jgi:hypothetical protein
MSGGASMIKMMIGIELAEPLSTIISCFANKTSLRLPLYNEFPTLKKVTGGTIIFWG